MDIGSKAGYPASSLSNFSPHPFVIDGIHCASMEGFLQSLKFKSPEMQVHVCTLVGRAAKAKGRLKNWRVEQKLYWRGEAIDRHSQEYQKLLDRAYEALFQNEGFRRALKASGITALKHSMGKNNPSDTVLTVQEFCSRLERLRSKL